VSELSKDLNKFKLWILELWSVAGLEAPLLARAFSIVWRTVKKAAVKWSRVLVSVLPAWQMGKAKISSVPNVSREPRLGGVLLSHFLNLNVPFEVYA
jgi:hypothetical protein